LKWQVVAVVVEHFLMREEAVVLSNTIAARNPVWTRNTATSEAELAAATTSHLVAAIEGGASLLLDQGLTQSQSDKPTNNK